MKTYEVSTQEEFDAVPREEGAYVIIFGGTKENPIMLENAGKLLLFIFGDYRNHEDLRCFERKTRKNGKMYRKCRYRRIQAVRQNADVGLAQAD